MIYTWFPYTSTLLWSGFQTKNPRAATTFNLTSQIQYHTTNTIQNHQATYTLPAQALRRRVRRSKPQSSGSQLLYQLHHQRVSQSYRQSQSHLLYQLHHPRVCQRYRQPQSQPRYQLLHFRTTHPYPQSFPAITRWTSLSIGPTNYLILHPHHTKRHFNLPLLRLRLMYQLLLPLPLHHASL